MAQARPGRGRSRRTSLFFDTSPLPPFGWKVLPSSCIGRPPSLFHLSRGVSLSLGSHRRVALCFSPNLKIGSPCTVISGVAPMHLNVPIGLSGSPATAPRHFHVPFMLWSLSLFMLPSFKSFLSILWGWPSAVLMLKLPAPAPSLNFISFAPSSSGSSSTTKTFSGNCDRTTLVPGSGAMPPAYT